MFATHEHPEPDSHATRRARPWLTSVILHAEDRAAADAILDGVTRCSRHALLVAALRFGLATFRQDPASLAAHLPARAKLAAPR